MFLPIGRLPVQSDRLASDDGGGGLNPFRPSHFCLFDIYDHTDKKKAYNFIGSEES